MIGTGTGGAKAPPVSFAVLAASLAGLLLAACSTQPSTEESIARAETLGWRMSDIETGTFPLRVLLSPLAAAKERAGHLTIYIEGDGNAWLSSTRASPDPTPKRATALAMALADGGGHVVYLGRPCQYIRVRACSPEMWTSARYGEQILRAIDGAIDRVKVLTGASSLQLVGYSGGGTLAVLAASRREDVTGIITVAANLDIEAWVRIRGLTPLYGSLNPAALGPAAARVPQIHLAAEDDEVVPMSVLDSFLRRTGQAKAARLRVVPGMDHRSDWSAIWPDLVRQARALLAAQVPGQVSFAPRAGRRPSSR